METRCGQLGVLPRDRGEGVCPLEAGHDQAGPVVPREVEGKSAADGCARSLGGIEAPEALVVARIPSESVVLVCVVSRCVFTSVFKCVLQRMHNADGRRCVRGATCLNETPVASESPCFEETPCVNETPCVSGVFASVPECVLPSTPCVKGAPQAEGAACAPEAARVCEPPCVSETPRVSAPAGVSDMVCVREARCVSERPRV